MDEATREQPKPKGSGRDVVKLAQADVFTKPLLIPERGYETVQLWVRSAAAYFKSRQLEDQNMPLEYLPSPAQIGKELTEDFELRARLGESKYGERLRAFNGRDPLVDAYQELLDAWLYLRQHEEEQG